MLSVVIAYRPPENLLDRTVQQVRDTATHEHEVIVVEDRPPIGDCRRRHQGIIQARGDIVVVLDAHMTMTPGWMDVAAQAGATDVGCAVCAVCNEADMDIGPETELRYGARMVWSGPPDPSDAQRRPRALWREWARVGRMPCEIAAPVEVGCVMGACYVMRRHRYFDIGAPWQYPMGWGWSEQILSLANWLHGGRSVVLPFVAGHCFRATTPYGGVETWRVVSNQMLLLHSMVPDPDRTELVNLFRPRNAAPQYGLKAITASGALKALQSHVAANKTREWADYRARWIDGRGEAVAAVPARADDPPAVQPVADVDVARSSDSDEVKAPRRRGRRRKA